MTRSGVPFLATLPLAFVVTAAVGAVLERTLYRRLYKASASRPGALLDRPHVHGDRRRDVRLRPLAAAGAPAGVPARARSRVLGLDLGAYRLFLDRAWSSRSRSALAAADRAHALRRADARLGRQPQAVARARHQRRSRLQRSPSRWAPGSRAWAARSASTCSGSTRRSRSSTWCISCWSWRSAARARSRAARRRAAARRVRRRRQVLRAAGRRVRHLRADGRAADRLPRRALRAADMSGPLNATVAGDDRAPAAERSLAPLEIAFWLLPVAAFFAASRATSCSAARS